MSDKAYKNNDSFMLMLYKCSTCGQMEQIWLTALSVGQRHQ